VGEAENEGYPQEREGARVRARARERERTELQASLETLPVPAKFRRLNQTGQPPGPGVGQK
jgi:hypothetical protein